METFTSFLVIAGKVLFLLVCGAVLFLHWVGLPANWILLALGVVYAAISGFDAVGGWALLAMAGLAGLAEVLEFGVGVGYTAKKGATRWGVLGTFVGGIAGAILCAPVAPPFGSVVGAFLGSFAGAVLLEYVQHRKLEAALRTGRAAFIGKVLAGVAKTMCGFWMWGILAYEVLMN